MSLRLPDYFNLDENHPQPEDYSHIYKAVATTDYGMSDCGGYITGIELAIVDYGNGQDSLQENLYMVGSEALIHQPEDGLQIGSYYEVDEACTSTDWETGHCDDTELYIRKVV